MTETLSPTAKSAETVDPSPDLVAVRTHLEAAIALLRGTDEAALHTMAHRLTAELDDLTFASGYDHAPW